MEVRVDNPQLRLKPGMFARISGVYDRMNHVLSLNLDRRWRRRLAARGWLERSFTWLPVLAAFVLALAVGLVAAARLGAGITEPVRRLVAGHVAEHAGQWRFPVRVQLREQAF